MDKLLELAQDLLSRDTIPKGRRLVIHEFLPQTVTVRGQTIIVYDVELMLMFCRQWSAEGLSRREIEDIWLAPASKLIARG